MKQVTVKNITLGQGIPKICIPLVEETPALLLNAAGELTHSPADLAEWRADCMKGILEDGMLHKILPELRTALKGLPLLFTFRSTKEGGNQAASPQAYEALLSEAICSGVTDLVDIELFSEPAAAERLIALAKKQGVKTILSNHDFNATPSEEELLLRLQRMDFLGADIAKIAVMPQAPEDVLTLLHATLSARRQLSCPVITMSMKGTGLISRLCGEVFGSCLTFGCAGKASAPGQIDAKQLQTLLTLLHDGL